MRDFKKLEIWQLSIKIVTSIYKIADKLPSNERFGIRSQIYRAAVSIPSNIAEGCSRSSEADFKRFLEIALGSAFELETQLIIINELELVDKNVVNSVIELLKLEQKKTNSLISKIKYN